MPAPAFIFRQVATVEVYEGETGRGGPAYADPVTVSLQIEPSQGLVIDAGGRTVQRKAVALLPPETTIPPESRLTFGGETFRVISALAQPGPSGAAHHIEASLG